MAASEGGGEGRCPAPRMENAEDAERGPHGVRGEVEGVFQSVGFRLVALRDLGAHAAPKSHAVFESVTRGGREAGETGGEEF